MPLAPILGALTLALSDYSTAQLHSVPGAGDALDVQTTGSATLAYSRPSWVLSLRYSPTLIYVDVLNRDEPALMHSVSLGYVWTRKRLTFSLRETASFGRQSYLVFGNVAPVAPANAPGANPQPGGVGAPAQAPGYLPRQQVVYYDSFTTSAGFGYALTRRWAIAGTLSYVISGGLGSSAAILPRSYGPTAILSLSFTATRRDTLTTSLSEGYLVVPSLNSRYFTSTVVESWGHALSQRTQTTLAAGVSELHSRANAQANDTDSFLATCFAGIANTRPLGHDTTLKLNASVGLSTPYNPVLGIVQQQLFEYAGSTLQKGRLTTTVYVSGSESLPQSAPTATRLLGAGAQSFYALTKGVGISVGAAWSTQILPPTAGGAVPDQWLLFAGLGLAAPPIDF